MRSALGALLDLPGQPLDFFGFLDHGQRQHRGGIGFFHLVFQLGGEVEQFLDILLDVLLIFFQQHFGRGLCVGIGIGGIISGFRGVLRILFVLSVKTGRRQLL